MKKIIILALLTFSVLHAGNKYLCDESANAMLAEQKQIGLYSQKGSVNFIMVNEHFQKWQKHFSDVKIQCRGVIPDNLYTQIVADYTKIQSQYLKEEYIK